MKRSLLWVIFLVFPLSGFGLVQNNQPEEKTRKAQGWLGVSIQDVTEKIAKKHNLKSEEGAYISDVTEDSPAESAGFQKGDVVVEFDGKAIHDADDLSKSVRKLSPGTKAKAEVIRKGERKTIEVTVGKRPREESFAFAFPRVRPPVIRMFETRQFFGLRLMELNKQLGEYFGAPEGEGVLVEEVVKESSAEKAGIKAGDVILKIGKRSINDLGDVGRAIDFYRDEGKIDVEVLRKGVKKTFSLDLSSAEDESDRAFWYKFSPGHGDLHELTIPEQNLDLKIGYPRDLRIHLDGLRQIQRNLRFRPPLDAMRSAQSI
jgi:C-terminal processing protease CtpA/Prc